jgi:alpha-1,2-mannosyltransferase
VKLMRIVVAHHSLNIPGGAEKLCLSVIEALGKKGHEVSLLTVEKTDWNLVQNCFGTVVLPDKEHYFTATRFSNRLANISVSATYFSIYVLQLLANRSRRNHDLIMNTFGDAINSMADITYVHFPLRAASMFSQIPAFTNRSMWRAIAPAYNSVMSVTDRIEPGNLLTNSKFVQGIIGKILGRSSLVVYPPVDVETFSSNALRDAKEDFTVAVIASYTPKRHLEQVPLIARHSKYAKFLIMGKADEYSAPTFAKLRRLMCKFHVNDRIALLQNVPNKEFIETLSKAKVYLHIMPLDHFGISVVEAMASGCVPVVHKSGGPWMDILDQKQGTYGFSYSSPREAAEHIDMLLTHEDLRSKIASRASQRSRRFDKAVFMKKIAEVVERVAR